MNWIQNLSKAVDFIEDNLTNEICLDEVSRHAFSSGSHFQLIFHVVMGLTVGEYIRNRRLSLAALDLLKPKSKIIDVAMRYQYDTQESFSKAFTRFHGVSPSKLRRGQNRLFNPLVINLTIQGGFEMSWKFNSEFHLVDWNEIEGQQSELSAEDKYKRIIGWAGAARGTNPNAFDALTEWILTDSQWTEDKLAENEQILIHGVLARFKEQNARLRAYLKELEPSGVVNAPVFNALDDFDRELSGDIREEYLRDVVATVFEDFTIMRELSIREKIAGGVTGRTGTDSVELFGYINHLKNCDAQVQWCLFMPDVVKRQQNGFQVDSFEYKQMPAIRFIGCECLHNPSDDKEIREKDIKIRDSVFSMLNEMQEHKSGFDYDLLFMHHYGKGVDKEPWHGFWGRFMAAVTPVPEGFVYWDFVPGWSDASHPARPCGPDDSNTPYLTFRSQFAFSLFSGDLEAMHKREGYDSDAMYDVTRNIILGQGVTIPYPEIYWTAEVFLDGYNKPGTAYMFSVVL